MVFSSLDVHLHTEALLNTMNFLTNLLPQSAKKEAGPEELPTIPEEEEAEGEKEGEKREETAVIRKKCMFSCIIRKACVNAERNLHALLNVMLS